MTNDNFEHPTLDYLKNSHAEWVKLTAHSDPGMIYLRKALASVVKQQIGITELHVMADGETVEIFKDLTQKTLAQAAKWVLEIDGEVGFNFFTNIENGEGAWIGAWFHGGYTTSDCKGIIADYSAILDLPD